MSALSLSVMAGLVPAIPPNCRSADGRDEPGHDDLVLMAVGTQ